MLEIQSSKIVLTLVDTETGELFTKEATFGDFKEVKKSTSTRTKKSKDDGESEPMIHLLDNKLQFNNKALELTGFEPDDKILVQFEKKGKVISPVIMKDEKGNRMTKTGTVSFRGQQRENLLKYGENFIIEEYGDIFKLIGDSQENEETDIIEIPEEISTDLDETIDPLNIDFSFD